MICGMHVFSGIGLHSFFCVYGKLIEVLWFVMANR